MIAGLETLTDGLIFFNEMLVNSLSPKERDVAMVFQSYALYPHMTVYENIAFPLRMKKEKISSIDGEVKRVAGLLGLEDFLGKKPKELSGGQRQRVARQGHDQKTEGLPYGRAAFEPGCPAQD
jgi:multiple sugar transport system ATP-binding protein